MRLISVKFFLISSRIFLGLTGLAKILSALGHLPILQIQDPILFLSYKNLFLSAGAVELAVASACFLKLSDFVHVGLVAWLATSFLAYRVGLIIGAYNEPCPCLGSLASPLHIQQPTADLAMKILLAYLLVGSYAALFWLGRQGKALIAISAE